MLFGLFMPSDHRLSLSQCNNKRKNWLFSLRLSITLAYNLTHFLQQRVARLLYSYKWG